MRASSACWHYPAPDRELEPGQLRCGVHTDLGMMTILRNEAAAGGLQVRPRASDWIDAPAIDDTFIVNIGDLLIALDQRPLGIHAAPRRSARGGGAVPLPPALHRLFHAAEL